MSASTITVNTQKQERVYFLWAMTLLLVIAVAIRLVFFRGLFGSDDFTYIVRALEIASGEWTSSNYNGALRYGFNIPAGLFLALFGPNIFAANLFSFLCSLGEVALVGWFARSQWGIRTGLIAAAIITVLPLHVSAASNIHVDPIVAFFITLSFVLFWFAEKKRSKQHYFLTGLSMGFVFWARELIIVYLAVFLIYALVERRLDWRWMYIFWGGFVLLLGHLLLMLFITGDPFHGFKVYFMQIGRDFIGGSKETGAFYYLGYLFRDLRHTWILAYLALGGLVVTWRDRRSNVASSDRFLLVWLLGMLVIFSFTPISLWPFQFITKQSNYLNIFFAPLCLVAARFLAGFSMRWLTITLTITMLGGFALSGLSQQDLRKFVSNSRAAAAFASAHPDREVFGSVNNHNVSGILLALSGKSGPKVRMLEELQNGGRLIDMPVLIIVDNETLGWNSHDQVIEEMPKCWHHVTRLEPEGFGYGWWIAYASVKFLEVIPGGLGKKVRRPFENLMAPKPADVYEAPAIDPWCKRAR